jgi:hypothetical protein
MGTSRLRNNRRGRSSARAVELQRPGSARALDLVQLTLPLNKVVAQWLPELGLSAEVATILWRSAHGVNAPRGSRELREYRCAGRRP